MRAVHAAALLLFLAAGAALLLAEDASATHFRGGTVYAVPTGGLGFSAQGRMTFRTGYASGFTCSVGVVAPAAFNGNLVLATSGGATQSTRAFALRVTDCDPTGVWFTGKVVDTALFNDGVAFTAPAALDPTGNPWQVYWTSGARLSFPSGHINNPDMNWELQATVDLANTPDQPPRPWVPSVVPCPTSGSCVVPVAAADNDLNDTLSVRFSTSQEATGGFGFDNPGPCPPKGAPSSAGCGGAVAATVDNSDPANLKMRWTTTGAATTGGSCGSLYSAQLMVMDGRERSPIDFFVRLCDNPFPQWSAASPCTQTLTVVTGDTITVTVGASSSNPARQVTMLAVEKPPGATASMPAAGNSVSGTLTWDTTGAALGDYLAVFYAYDDQQLATVTCQMHIRVVPSPTVDFSWLFTTTAPLNLSNDPVAFTDLSTATLAGTAAMSWSWAFNDGLGGSAMQDPIHTFIAGSVAGTPYSVCLTLRVSYTQPWTGTTCHPVVVFDGTPPARPPEPPRPMAVADCFSSTGSLEVPPPGLVANDLIETGTFAQARLVSPPAHAQSFALRTDGSFSYRPRPGFLGTDWFLYQAVQGNGNASRPAAVCIDIVRAAGNLGPHAEFAWAPAAPAPGDMVAFVDESTDNDGTLTTWNWDLAGTPGQGQTPSLRFALAGSYAVTLTVTDDQGATASVMHTVLVAAPPPSRNPTPPPPAPPRPPDVEAPRGPAPAFTATQRTPLADLAVQFVPDDATGTGYAWSFGDGRTALGTLPVHPYAAAGTYHATLVYDDAKGNMVVAARDVVVQAPAVADDAPSGTDMSRDSGASDPAFPGMLLATVGAAGAAGVVAALLIVVARRRKADPPPPPGDQNVP